MLNPGDLIFVRGHLWDPVDDAIKEGEHILDHTPMRGNYVHCAVYVGGNIVMEAQGFRRSGRANIGDYTGDYDVGHLNVTDQERTKFLVALHDENHLPYDWPGIWWLIVKIITGYDRKYHEHRRRYCSKYVGWALRRAGVIVNDRTPEDLARDPRVAIEIMQTAG